MNKGVQRRIRVLARVRDEVLREAGYMCGNPPCRHILTLELDHMVWVMAGGGNDANNLIELCPNCHSLHTRGHIPASATRHWKGILVALNQALSREEMALLLYLHKIPGDCVWLSGDGLIKFASLIAAGLVVFDSCYSEGKGRRGFIDLPETPPGSAHHVYLSEKGKGMVDAWLTGDERAADETARDGRVRALGGRPLTARSSRLTNSGATARFGYQLATNRLQLRRTQSTSPQLFVPDFVGLRFSGVFSVVSAHDS